MIWFCLIVLALILSDSYHKRPDVAVACIAGLVALTYLHFWVIGAIP